MILRDDNVNIGCGTLVCNNTETEGPQFEICVHTNMLLLSLLELWLQY